VEAQAAITLLQMSQDRQQKSATSTERKDRIVDHLFQNRRETFVKLNLYRGLLDTFQGFVKTFQTEKPLIHTLHEQMVVITRELLGMFIKPEHIPNSITDLLKLDVTDRNIQKPDRDLGVGKYAFTDLNKARLDKRCKYWTAQLYTDLRTGYIMAAKKMLSLPLGNKTLRRLAALDPKLANHSQTSASLKWLCQSLPNMFNDMEAGKLAVEVDRYCVSQQVKELASEYNDDRIDTGYWGKVFGLKISSEVCFPTLKKLISALLTVFSGPLIESTFNIMDDIVEKDRTALTVANYEAVAIIKTALRMKKTTSTKMTVSRNLIKSCINAYANYQHYLKQKKELEEEKRAQKLNTSIHLLKIEKTKRISKLVRLKNKIVNRKRKQNDSGQGQRFKRIKML